MSDPFMGKKVEIITGVDDSSWECWIVDVVEAQGTKFYEVVIDQVKTRKRKMFISCDSIFRIEIIEDPKKDKSLKIIK